MKSFFKSIYLFLIVNISFSSQQKRSSVLSLQGLRIKNVKLFSKREERRLWGKCSTIKKVNQSRQQQPETRRSLCLSVVTAESLNSSFMSQSGEHRSWWLLSLIRSNEMWPWSLGVKSLAGLLLADREIWSRQTEQVWEALRAGLWWFHSSHWLPTHTAASFGLSIRLSFKCVSELLLLSCCASRSVESLLLSTSFSSQFLGVTSFCHSALSLWFQSNVHNIFCFYRAVIIYGLHSAFLQWRPTWDVTSKHLLLKKTFRRWKKQERGLFVKLRLCQVWFSTTGFYLIL